jgi:hypothetical protein
MQSKISKEKTELVFKLEKNPEGFSQVLAQNCEVKIKNSEGLLYLNYEHRPERVVGSYKNLRQEGELILADVRLIESLTPIEDRIEFSIEGSVLKKNEAGEAEAIEVKGVGALMHNKF